MKWGILATGNIARKFASTINQMSKENEQLAAVGSRHMDSAKAFAREHDIPRYYDSYEALVNDPDVEAVYVATPNSLHYENCRLCLEHGKHVLCEKPFTINEKQAQELYRLAKDKHLFIMEGLWIWFLPLYNRLRNILLKGTIGEIKHISCQYGFVATGARKERKFNSALGGGALLDIGIYNLGFLRIVTGCDPQNVETTKVHINVPAAVANLLVFAVVGIWHGPQAHYLVWGLYNGLVIALADLLEPAFKKLNTALHIPTESRGWHVFRIVRTFIIVNIGWYFDRNEFVQGCIYLRNTFTDFNLSALAANAPGAFAAVSGPAWGLVIISTLLVFAHSVLKEQGRDPYAEVQRLPLALRWGLYYLVIFMVLLSFICVNETVGFLYANF